MTKPKFSVSALMLWLGCLTLWAQRQDPVVQFELQLSQTAIWVGDLLEYRITLFHDDKVEILRDNLKPENINMDPFGLVDLTIKPRRSGQVHVLEIVFRLTILDEVASEVVIPSLNIYYSTRRPGPLGRGTEIETHTLVIPEKKIGLRSTLTSDSKDIRDTVTVEPPGFVARTIWIPGWIVIGLFVFQTARWSLARYRQETEKRRHIDRDAVGRQALSALDQLDGETRVEELSERCQQISEILRNTVREVVEIEAASLTPEELREELVGKNVKVSLVDGIYNVLKECEVVSYAHPTSTDEKSDLGTLIGSCRDGVSQLVRL